MKGDNVKHWAMPASVYQRVLINFFVSVDFSSQPVRHADILCVACPNDSILEQLAP